jgi:hypothetical protein
MMRKATRGRRFLVPMTTTHRIPGSADGVTPEEVVATVRWCPSINGPLDPKTEKALDELARALARMTPGWCTP